MIKWIRNKIYCWKHGHNYKFDGYTLGGDWIKCTRCHRRDEFLPGLHEPKNYCKSVKRPAGRHHFLGTDSTYGF